MIQSKTYKFFPYINNSFDDTLKTFVEYYIRKYDIIESKYNNISIIIDNTQIGSSFSKMKKPEYIYITINFYSHDSWLSTGGIEYFNGKTDILTISIRWDTTYNGMNVKRRQIDEIDIGFFRKIKLQKLSEIK